MRRSDDSEHNTGEAISIEDALSMLTVIFVLFVVILVPMVTIDKVRLVKAKRNPFWSTIQTKLSKDNPVSENEFYSYSKVFEAIPLNINSYKTLDEFYCIEALMGDSSVIVVAHNVNDNSFFRIHAMSYGTVRNYQQGELYWDNNSKQWITIDFNVVYQNSTEANIADSLYRSWQEI